MNWKGENQFAYFDQEIISGFVLYFHVVWV